MIRTAAVFTLAMVLCLGYIGFAQAQESPKQILGAVTAQVVDILKQQSSEHEKQEEIRQIVKEKFDLREMAKRTLGRPWKDLIPEKQEEYVKAFEEWFLYTNPYVTQTGKYAGEEMTIGKEILEETFATVQAQVPFKDKLADLKFSFLLKDSEWRVYDVEVEGVSMVSNYKSQFAGLVSESMETLLAQLKEKTQVAKGNAGEG